MALPTALLVKGGIGVATVATPISTYFIIKEVREKRLREENEEFNKKITALGIDSGCHFEDIKDKAECELEEAKVKTVKFDGKTGDTVTGLDGDKKIKLVIEKGYAIGDFPRGLRFTFKNTQDADVEIGTDDNKITLKAGVSYDFKITSDETKLEKAWTITTLGDKVGLTCTNGGSSTTCTIKTEGINVWKDNSGVTNAKATETNKQVSVTKDQKDYLEGFKFTVSEDIALTVDGNNGSGISKLTKTNMSYRIDVKEVDGTKTWFLIEKSTESA